MAFRMTELARRASRMAGTAACGALMLGAQLIGSTPARADLDPTDPNDVLTMQRKIQCSTVDGEPQTYWWTGYAYSRVPGERDRRLFGLHGMNVRTCVTVEDEERGTGYRLLSREIMLYTDPVTDEVLETWDNPFTGETVEVLHVHNDPVNQPPSLPVRRDGSPVTWGGYSMGDQTFWRIEVPLFYTNPLAGPYQRAVGGQYQAMEMFAFFMDTDDLMDEDTTRAERVNVNWGRVAQWLPWMYMGDRPGLMVFHASGMRLDSWDDLPDHIKAAIREDYPAYTDPPPLDDDRPNETSWTVYQRLRPPADMATGHSP